VLPESICNLTTLKDLNLNFNNLKVLPDLIWELKSLVSLKAIDNNLEFLPESIKNLENLDYKIKEIAGLQNLVNLDYVPLDGNPVSNWSFRYRSAQDLVKRCKP